MKAKRETYPHQVWRAMRWAETPLTAKQICRLVGFASLEVLRAILWQMVRHGYATRCGTKPQTYLPLSEPPQPRTGPKRSVVKLRIETVRAALDGDAIARAEVEQAIGGAA